MCVARVSAVSGEAREREEPSRVTILHRTSMWHMGVTHTRSTLYDTAHPPPRVHRAVRRETRAPATTPVHRAPPPAHRGDPDRGSRSIDSPWTPCVQYILYSVSQSVSHSQSVIYIIKINPYSLFRVLCAPHTHTHAGEACEHSPRGGRRGVTRGGHARRRVGRGWESGSALAVDQRRRRAHPQVVSLATPRRLLIW